MWGFDVVVDPAEEPRCVLQNVGCVLSLLFGRCGSGGDQQGPAGRPGAPRGGPPGGLQRAGPFVLAPYTALNGFK